MKVLNQLRHSTEIARRAKLILVEQSGAKRQISLPSPVDRMIEAEWAWAMRQHGLRPREVKVVSQHKAIAHWKAEELGWRRVA
jgi:hypothetical protein